MIPQAQLRFCLLFRSIEVDCILWAAEKEVLRARAVLKHSRSFARSVTLAGSAGTVRS